MNADSSSKRLPGDIEKLIREGSVAELKLDPNFPLMPEEFRIDFKEYFEFCGENPESGPEMMKKFLEMKLNDINDLK